jgi:uncharacterized membrane protein HdeD (DUF308 family)
MEKANKIMQYLAYVLAVIFILLGISVILGGFVPREFPSQFRWTAGIVLVLYGIFRIVYTYYRNRESLNEDE